MTERAHEEYRENIGAYVLGALPELEAELLERHLAGCDGCRAEVEELQPVTAALARSVPQMEPPASLKAGLMATVRAEAAERAGSQADRGRLARWLSGLQPRMAAAAALAVLVLGVAIGVAVDRVAGGGESTQTLAAQIDRRLMPTGDASLEVSGDSAKLELTGAPAPPPGRVYQLWFQHGKRIDPGTTFAPRGDGSFEATLPLDGADAVMVTVEREGGVRRPTGPPVMQFDT